MTGKTVTADKLMLPQGTVQGELSLQGLVLGGLSQVHGDKVTPAHGDHHSHASFLRLYAVAGATAQSTTTTSVLPMLPLIAPDHTTLLPLVAELGVSLDVATICSFHFHS